MPDEETARIRAQAASSALVRLWRALLPLKSVLTFLQTGAHPDDETSGMLARLRSDGLRLAYVCATRGEGGQNTIGPETGEDLGLIRTAEMEAAARALDMELHWLGGAVGGSIVDFGFSKSGEDTLSRWGAARSLERLVRVIRMVRPDMICPTFLDVPGQHGHHRAVARLTERAFEMAADPQIFPEHEASGLTAWPVSKFYLPAFSGASTSYDDAEAPPQATTEVDIGAFDPFFGATYAQIGEWSRVWHRTQGMGRWIEPGPAVALLHLKSSRLGRVGAENTIFDGLPRTLADLAGEGLGKAQAEIDQAIAAFPHRSTIIGALARALDLLRNAPTETGHAHRVTRKITETERALAEALLLVAELTFERPSLAPGESTKATLSLYAGGSPFPVVHNAFLDASEGWNVQLVHEEGDDASARGQHRVWRFRISAPEQMPFPHSRPEPLRGRFELGIGATSFTLRVPPIEALAVLPKTSVTVSPARKAIRVVAGDAQPIAIELSVTGEGGTEIRLPEGWRSDHAKTITPPPDLPEARFELTVLADGQPAFSVTSLAYPHIGKVHAVRPARMLVGSLQVALPEAGRIGHVAGGVDKSAEYLAQVGLPIERIDDDMLRQGDLTGFDTILVGVFAFRTRPVLSTTLPRLKSWVEAGGNLVTLYHRPGDNWDAKRTPMAAIEIGQPSLRWRVSDPQAPVTVLLPDHPVLAHPNRIGPADWQGWIKERGLYFAKRWAPDYQALIETADPGETPHRGALLIGRFGKGRHAHVALALHTQLANLVPGGFRLMANLLTPADR